MNAERLRVNPGRSDNQIYKRIRAVNQLLIIQKLERYGMTEELENLRQENHTYSYDTESSSPEVEEEEEREGTELASKMSQSPKINTSPQNTKNAFKDKLRKKFPTMTNEY